VFLVPLLDQVIDGREMTSEVALVLLGVNRMADWRI
jgi:hypothetical protein